MLIFRGVVAKPSIFSPELTGLAKEVGLGSPSRCHPASSGSWSSSDKSYKVQQKKKASLIRNIPLTMGFLEEICTVHFGRSPPWKGWGCSLVHFPVETDFRFFFAQEFLDDPSSSLFAWWTWLFLNLGVKPSRSLLIMRGGWNHRMLS